MLPTSQSIGISRQDRERQYLNRFAKPAIETTCFTLFSAYDERTVAELGVCVSWSHYASEHQKRKLTLFLPESLYSSVILRRIAVVNRDPRTLFIDFKVGRVVALPITIIFHT